jgi:hypothetical protein
MAWSSIVLDRFRRLRQSIRLDGIVRHFMVDKQSSKHFFGVSQCLVRLFALESKILKDERCVGFPPLE